MDKSIVELAKLFKDRDNKKVPNYVIGKVISPLPNLKISDGSFIVLGKDNLKVTELFFKNNSIEVNDSVLMIPSSDEQKYIVIDKVVSI